MKEEEIFKRLTELIHDTFDDDDLEVTPELCSADVEAWTSLGTIRLLSAVEDEFDVQFNVDEIYSLQHVAAWVELIRAKSKSK